jgi:polyferredoxin
VCLFVAVIVCGFVLGKSPNPMEGTVKVLKSMVGLYPSIIEKVVVFVFFIFLAIVGNKLICGWACPFGGLQELIYSIPLFRKFKKHKLPFAVTNTIRAVLFVTTLLIMFGVIGNRKGFVLYHYLNPFNLFDLHFEHWLILSSVIVFLIMSIFTYRPFCHFVCPFGFVSWIMERFSLFKVNVDKEKCTECGLCIKACPAQAAKDKVSGKLLGADCFSCTRCLNVCPQDAIKYSSVFNFKKK